MDDFTVCNILFDGQFWIAIVTRFRSNRYYEARYTFGLEPTGPELLLWTDSLVTQLVFVPVPKPTAVKKLLKPACSCMVSKKRYTEALRKQQEEKRKGKQDHNHQS